MIFGDFRVRTSQVLKFRPRHIQNSIPKVLSLVKRPKIIIYIMGVVFAQRAVRLVLRGGTPGKR